MHVTRGIALIAQPNQQVANRTSVWNSASNVERFYATPTPGTRHSGQQAKNWTSPREAASYVKCRAGYSDTSIFTASVMRRRCWHIHDREIFKCRAVCMSYYCTVYTIPEFENSNLADICQRFEDTCYFHLQEERQLKIIGSCETWYLFTYYTRT